MYLWKGNRFHSGFTTLLPSVDGHSNSSKVPTKSLHTISSSFSFTFRKLLALTKRSDQPFAKLSCSQHSQVRFITYYYVDTDPGHEQSRVTDESRTTHGILWNNRYAALVDDDENGQTD